MSSAQASLAIHQFCCRKKDKIAHCVSVTEVLCSQGVKNSPESAKYLAMAMEMFFTLLDDKGDY